MFEFARVPDVVDRELSMREKKEVDESPVLEREHGPHETLLRPRPLP